MSIVAKRSLISATAELLFIPPLLSRGSVLAAICLSVCMSACLSLSTITQQVSCAVNAVNFHEIREIGSLRTTEKMTKFWKVGVRLRGYG